MQLSPSAQVTPQPPQFWGSSSTGVSQPLSSMLSQSAYPTSQAQSASVQNWLSPHATSQRPQFAASAVGSMQLPSPSGPQHSSSAAQTAPSAVQIHAGSSAAMHCPSQQSSPRPQHVSPQQTAPSAHASPSPQAHCAFKQTSPGLHSMPQPPQANFERRSSTHPSPSQHRSPPRRSHARG